MFDIRKVQEKVMYEAVRAKSNADVAGEVVYGCEKAAHTENNSDFIPSFSRIFFIFVSPLTDIS